MADTLEGCAAIQRELDRPEKWTDKSIMKLSKQCRDLHQWRNNLNSPVCAGDNQLENSFAERDLGVLVATKVTMVVS